MVLQFLAVTMLSLSLPFASSAFGSTRVSTIHTNNDGIPIKISNGSCMQTTSHDSSSSQQRRDVISKSSRAISSLLVWNLSLPTTNQALAEEVPYQRITSSIPKIAQYIMEECNSEFLASVSKSNYNFLYRGLSPEQSKAATNGSNFAAILLKDETFDLLDSNTYNSKEAATYFQSLEDEMTTKGMTMKPSNSHIGTTCPKEASKWGQAASVWPWGERGVEFAWLVDGGTFWPIDRGTSSRKNRRLVTSSAAKHGLADALQGDAWDIMFRADNGFLAVPADIDTELRAYLREMQR